MNGAYNRSKGIRGEQEVCRYIMGAMIQVEHELKGPLGHQFVEEFAESKGVGRNLDQSRDGGCDIKVEGICAIEVKKREAITLNPWWEQAAKSAADLKLMPVLIWKPNGRQPWRVRTWAAVHTEWVMADMLLDDWLRGFKALYRERLKARHAAIPK